VIRGGAGVVVKSFVWDFETDSHSHMTYTTIERTGRRLPIPARRFRIGELVRYGPFSRQTIHNYTIMGLIREVEWTEGGHRLYDESVFERLARIAELRETKSLAEIRRILAQEKSTDQTDDAGANQPDPVADSAGPSPGDVSRRDNRLRGEDEMPEET
jgi:DNA-binding transcriptional MerR regulator